MRNNIILSAKKQLELMAQADENEDVKLLYESEPGYRNARELLRIQLYNIVNNKNLKKMAMFK